MRSKGIAIPYVVWMAIFVVAPLILVVVYAVTNRDGSLTAENFASMTQYASVFGRSFLLALVATVVCILLGYPMAYFLARERGRLRQMATMLIMLPMWMNFLLRTYSWVFLLERNGFFNTLLETMGLPKLDIIDTQAAVVLGMVYNFLPFMVLPIFSVIEKMDHRLIEAAQDLGANSTQVFRRVIFPLSLPGVLSGVLNVFAGTGINILTINQNIPVNGCAVVTITAETSQMHLSLEDMLQAAADSTGVIRCEVLAG